MPTSIITTCAHSSEVPKRPSGMRDAAEAKPEHVARRDSFWSGVVLYREKRWAEAYSEFQKARGPEGEDDSALQFYLRRLEPLVLQLTESPLEES